MCYYLQSDSKIDSKIISEDESIYKADLVFFLFKRCFILLTLVSLSTDCGGGSNYTVLCLTEHAILNLYWMCLCPLNTVRINLVTLALITSKFMTCFQLLWINISCCVFPLFNRCLFSHAWPVLKRFRLSRQRELFDFLLRYEMGRNIFRFTKMSE